MESPEKILIVLPVSLVFFVLATPLMPPSIDDAPQLMYAVQGHHSFGERGDVRFQGSGFFWILRTIYRLFPANIFWFRFPGILAGAMAFFVLALTGMCYHDASLIFFAILPWYPMYFIRLQRLRADGYILLILALELAWILNPFYHPTSRPDPRDAANAFPIEPPSRKAKSIMAVAMGLLAGLSVWIYPSGLFVCGLIFILALWNFFYDRDILGNKLRDPALKWLWWALGCGFGLCFAMNQLDSRFWESVALNRYFWGSASQCPPHLWARVFYPILMIPVGLIFVCRYMPKWCLNILAVGLILGCIQTGRLIRFYRRHDLYFDAKFRDGYKRQKSYVGPLNLWWIDPHVKLTDSHWMDCDTTNMIPKMRHDL